MLLTLDIETLPTNDPAVIAEFQNDADKEKAELKAPSNYKDEAKIAEYIAAKATEIDAGIAEKVAKTSFNGMYGRIACICYAFDDGEVFTSSHPDERVMLECFFADIAEVVGIKTHAGKIPQPFTVVGHNVVGFDLPFIKHRSIINKVRPLPQFIKAFDAKPWGGEVADTMLMWSSDPHKRGSMDRLCKAFGIPGKDGFDGSMVADTWPTDPQKVIEYCKDDVRRTRELYKRLTFQF